MGRYLKEHPLTALFALVAVCALPMMILRDPSPSNELRYLSIVDEALREGHFFCFYNQGGIYTDKPPLFFWIMMLSRLVCGPQCMWLPTLLTALIPSLVTVAVMDCWLLLSCGSGRPTVAMRLSCASVALASALMMIQTFFLRMDVLMTMFIILALFTFYKMYTRRGARLRDKWLLPLYIFLALFTKGPVGFFAPVVAIVVFLALEHQLRRIGEFLGWRQWALMLALFGLWILGARLEGGKAYIDSLLFHQTMDRAVNAFTHKHPFWYYIPVMLYAVLPYTLLLIPATVSLYFRRTAGNKSARLMLTAIAATFIMLSAFSGKLAIYLTPIIPLMAYLLPLYGKRCGGRWEKWALMAVQGIFALGGAAILLMACGLMPASGEKLQAAVPYIFCPTIIAVAATLLAGSAAAIAVTARLGWQKGCTAVCAAMFAAVFAAGISIEPLNEWTAYEQVCLAAREDGQQTYNTLFVHRPENMDVYLGCDVADYSWDADKFVGGSHAGEVLITDTACAAENAPLREYLQGRECRKVGPFSIYRL